MAKAGLVVFALIFLYETAAAIPGNSATEEDDPAYANKSSLHRNLSTHRSGRIIRVIKRVASSVAGADHVLNRKPKTELPEESKGSGIKVKSSSRDKLPDLAQEESSKIFDFQEFINVLKETDEKKKEIESEKHNQQQKNSESIRTLTPRVDFPRLLHIRRPYQRAQAVATLSTPLDSKFSESSVNSEFFDDEHSIRTVDISGSRKDDEAKKQDKVTRRFHRGKRKKLPKDGVRGVSPEGQQLLLQGERSILTGNNSVIEAQKAKLTSTDAIKQSTSSRFRVSARPTKLPEQLRQKLYPSRRHQAGGIAKILSPVHRRRNRPSGISSQFSFGTSSGSSTEPAFTGTSTTSTTTNKPQEILATEKSAHNHDLNLEYLSYDELFDPAPSKPRYTPVPKRLDKPFVQRVEMKPVQVSPRNRPVKPQPTLLNSQPLIETKPPPTYSPQAASDDTPGISADYQQGESDQFNAALRDLPQLNNEAAEQDYSANLSADSVDSGSRLYNLSSPQFTRLPVKAVEGEEQNEESRPIPENVHPAKDFDYSDYEDLLEYIDYQDYLDDAKSSIFDQFRYGYKVAEEDTGNFHARTEERDGKKVVGAYEVVLPDGRIQTVSYIADDNGFRADVKYKGEEKDDQAEPDVTVNAHNARQRLQAFRPAVRKTEGRKSVRFETSQLPKQELNFHTNDIERPGLAEEQEEIGLINGHMTPWAWSTVRTTTPIPQFLPTSRGSSIVNEHFRTRIPHIQNPVNGKPVIPAFPPGSEAGSQVSRITNDEYHNPDDNLSWFSTSPRPEPTPRSIPALHHRDIARIPPNPFLQNRRRKKPHTPVKPLPKRVSLDPPSHPPIHPLLQPGGFNRPVTIPGQLIFDRELQNIFVAPDSPGTPVIPDSELFFPINNRVTPPGDLSVSNEPKQPIVQFIDPATVQRPNIIGNFGGFHLNHPTVAEFPVPSPRLPFIHPRGQVRHEQGGKIDFSEDVPVNPPSPNPFRLVVERNRASPFVPRRPHFNVAVPTTDPPSSLQLAFHLPSSSAFPSHLGHSELSNGQPDFDYVDVTNLPHIELLKTTTQQPEISHTISTTPGPVPGVTISTPVNILPTPAPINTVIPARTPVQVVTTPVPKIRPPLPVRDAPTIPLQTFRTRNPFQNNVRNHNFFNLGTPSFSPFNRLPVRSPLNPGLSHATPLFYRYPSINGTPTPTLIYNPNKPVFIHALGQTHAIPLLLPIDVAASENSEVTAENEDQSEKETLSESKLELSKSDIYPAPPRRLPLR